VARSEIARTNDDIEHSLYFVAEDSTLHDGTSAARFRPCNPCSSGNGVPPVNCEKSTIFGQFRLAR